MQMDSIKTYALYSRILVLIIQLVFNHLLPDHEPDVFNPPELYDSENMIDVSVQRVLGGLKRWDALYFMHIAEHGYTYENCLAFFPLFPLTVRFISNTILMPLQYIMNMNNVLLIAAVSVNIYCFVKATCYLFELGKVTTQNVHLSYKASILFCVNPASIFFSAPYSESMFSMFLFKGLLLCTKRNNLKASIYFGFAGLTRSNGIVAVGFFIYFSLYDLVAKIYLTLNIQLSDLKTKVSKYGIIFLSTAFSVLFYTLILLTPFGVYQYYAYKKFCSYLASPRDIPNYLLKYGKFRHYKMAHTGYSKWCHWKIPLSYSYIQSSHWGVGFLKYFEFKQIPNFTLAAPMIILCVLAILQYVSIRWRYCKTLGFQNFHGKVKENVKQYTGFLADGCFLHICYMTFLVFFGFFFMHVQVITRFVASSCPVLYWYAATVTATEDNFSFSENSESHNSGNSTDSKEHKTTLPEESVDWEQTGFNSRLIYIYFMLYLFVGTAAFSNFLPWT